MSWEQPAAIPTIPTIPTVPQVPQQYAFNYRPDHNTLWMGDLESWMDENFIKTAWYNLGEQVNVKIIRDKITGQSGYCFIEFSNPTSAYNALNTYNRTVIPGTTNTYFKLNWATGGAKKEEKVPEFSIFVGDLSPEVTDVLLASTFKARYPSCTTAKVIVNPMTGISKGYGFVRFTNEIEQQHAMTEMQGQYCGSRPIRIMPATTLKSKILASGGNPQQAMYQQSPLFNQHNDPNNTTVFVGNLTPNITEDDLRTYFQPFGNIIYVKISTNKACGFIQYYNRQDAENAIQQMAGTIIGTNKVKVSWGHTQLIDPKTINDPAHFSPTQIPFLNNNFHSHNDHANSNTYNNSSSFTEQNAHVMTEDTLPNYPVSKLNEIYMKEKDELVEKSLDYSLWEN